jgi:tetratricopeptide (TPR) repeat protein
MRFFTRVRDSRSLTLRPSRIFASLTAGLLVASGLSAQTARVGEVAFSNSGSTAAQASFLYGLAQLHNFEYDDAARAFRESQQTDPGFALAYWGEAMTKNHPVWMEQDLGGARRILERLGPTASARVARGANERERAWLGAVEALYGAGDKAVRDLAYLDVMKRVHADYPDDIEATAFYALALLGSAHGGRDTSIYMQAAAVLEQEFATHPNHPGLAHYLIHSYDDPVHAPLGLRAARRYFSIAPAAPHALHMTSHIYLAAGMWDEVVAANEQAGKVAADRALKAGRKPGTCGHANMWLMYGYLQQGRHAAARTILDGCRAVATGPSGLAIRATEQDPLDPDNIAAGSYIQMWSRYIIDGDDWNGDLAAEDIPLGTLAGPRLTRAFVRALQAAKRSDTAALRTLTARLQQERDALDAVLSSRHDGAERYRRRSSVLATEIQGMSLLAENRPDEAVASLREAAAAEDAMPAEFGPPFVDKPPSELLGDVLLALKRPEEARAAYESALRHTPNRAACLLGLARAASQTGATAAATDAYSRLRLIWRNADRVPEEIRD